MMKRTKIIATIGPSSDSQEMMSALIDSGMDVMRLNFSHGSHAEHKIRIDTMRLVCQQKKKNIAILLDTKGPEIRTMSLKNGKEVALRSGEYITFTTDQNHIGSYDKVAITYKGLPHDVKTGDTILLDDGLIGLEVLDTTENEIRCLIKNSAFLGEHKSLNVPNIHINLPALSSKDIEDIAFGCEMDVDFIAASFIRTPEDVQALRTQLKRHGKENIKIISKIESSEGIKNFDTILTYSDGIMVARGDLGVDIPIEDVPFAQKEMIHKCNKAGKTVITATQMLESMTKNPRPTRAEAGDIVNAILDGTDAVMLSGESAKGKYPKQAVQTMAKICERTDDISVEKTSCKNLSLSEAIASGTVKTANDISAKAIVILAESGTTARNIKRLRPDSVVIAITTNPKTANQLSLARGVLSTLIDDVKDVDDFHEKALNIASGYEFIEDKDVVVLSSGANHAIGITNLMKVAVINK